MYYMYLYDWAAVQHIVATGALEFFYLIQDLGDTFAANVNQSERRYIDAVIFEIFQVMRFNVLWPEKEEKKDRS